MGKIFHELGGVKANDNFKKFQETPISITNNIYIYKMPRITNPGAQSRKYFKMI